MPDLLRYRELAVDHYSGIPCALHLQYARQSLNLGNNVGLSPCFPVSVPGCMGESKDITKYRVKNNGGEKSKVERMGLLFGMRQAYSVGSYPFI